MKNKFSSILVLVLGLGLFSCPVFAINKSVTTVSAVASTVVTPGTNIHTLAIQNNGSGNVRLAFDGGSVYGLPDPTASTGYLLVAGSQIILTYPGDKRPPQIRAILVSGTTTTLDIATDDAGST